jgi:hypothetical protein
MPDRRLVITMNMHGVDHETFGSNESTRRIEVRETILSNTDQAMNVLEFFHGWGGECRLELRLTGTLLNDNTIRVQGTALLFEGTSEGSGDLDGRRDISFLVPTSGVVEQHNFRVNNDNEGGDFVDVQLTCTNSVVE